MFIHHHIFWQTLIHIVNTCNSNFFKWWQNNKERFKFTRITTFSIISTRKQQALKMWKLQPYIINTNCDSLNNQNKALVKGKWNLHIFKIPDRRCRCEYIQQTDDLKATSIILTLWAMFLPISTFLLFLVSELTCGEKCAYFLPIFGNYFYKFCHN